MGNPRTAIYRAIRDRTQSITTTAPPTGPPGGFWLTHATDAVMDLLMTREQQGAEAWAHCSRCGGMLADYPTGDMRCRGCEAEADRDRYRQALEEIAAHDGAEWDEAEGVCGRAADALTPRANGDR